MNDSLNHSQISDPAPAEELATILSRVVDNKAEYDIRLLAQQLGTNYRSLMYWLRGERNMPAYLLPRICTLLGNYEALDYLESQAGRMAFKLPDTKMTLEKELLAVSNLIREVGEALESVAETLADGIVEESELRSTVPKLEGVIQECASLKYLLEDLSKRRKKRTRNQ
jgi:vacuolar-type H+-ATPase subunit I/STV1